MQWLIEWNLKSRAMWAPLFSCSPLSLCLSVIRNRLRGDSLRPDPVRFAAEEKCGCFGKVFTGYGGYEIGYLDAYGTLGYAQGFLAVQTATGFGHGLFGCESEGDFVEIAGSFLRVLLLRFLACDGLCDGLAEVATVA